jgi:hypothetical protein
MGDSIKEQIAAILASAPSMEDHVAPFLGQIAELQKQLAKAKTNPKRQAIRRELNKLRRYVSHVTAQKRPRRQPPSKRQLRRQKAAGKKLAWRARKEDNQSRLTVSRS